MMSTSSSFLSRYQAAIVAVTAIIAGCTILYVQTAHGPSSAPEASKPPRNGLRRSNAQRRLHRNSNRLTAEEYFTPTPQTREQFHETDSGDSTNRSFGEFPANQEDENRINLLCRIAEEHSKSESYFHRGITCNGCHQEPIRGIRFRCMNCADYDLCEQCEANQIHTKTHIFYKIRIPIPLLSCQTPAPQPVCYPGKQVSQILPLPFDLIEQHSRETDFTPSEVKGLWDQFRCLARPTLRDDSTHSYLAIDRRSFDKCFIPANVVWSAATNLLYDRLFGFYDTNGDGQIGFSEFVNGLGCLMKPGKAEERLRRAFDGYDIDQNGWVDRKDFLRIFKAFYAIHKKLIKDVVRNEALCERLDEDAANRVLMGSQPISMAIKADMHNSTSSRTGEGKWRDEYGDDIVQDGGGILREPADTEDHDEALAKLAREDGARPASGFGPEACNFPKAEKDVGREVMYQVTQEAFNELLDPLFALNEDFSAAARRTRFERKEFRACLDAMTFDEQLIKRNLSEYQRDVRLLGRESARLKLQESMRTFLALIETSVPLGKPPDVAVAVAEDNHPVTLSTTSPIHPASERETSSSS